MQRPPGTVYGTQLDIDARTTGGMTMRLTRRPIGAAIALALTACGQAPNEPDTAATAAAPEAQPPVVAAGDWPLINRDLSANRYSPLTQITAANVAGLASSWTYELGGNSTAVPIVVDGLMYMPSRDRVVALDGDTGALVWEYVLPAPPAPPAPPASAGAVAVAVAVDPAAAARAAAAQRPPRAA